MTYALTHSQLDAYLARIGVERPVQADLAALRAIHRAHAFGFTWEAIDCFMGQPTSLDPDVAWDKMVARRRGGWCYEMNGLLGAALSALGFRVQRLCAAVRRVERGDSTIGNHLTLRVDLDAPWLADVGMGDSLIDPVPLRAGRFAQQGYAFAIEQADGDWLRLHNHPWAGAPTVDFRAGYTDETVLAQTQGWMDNNPESPFANTLVIERHFPDRIEAVVNTTRRTISPEGVRERPLAGLAEFSAVLDEVFGLDLPEAAQVWDKAASA